MTNILNRNLTLPSLEKFIQFQKNRGIGFDDLFNLIDTIPTKTSTYPPHNIYKRQVDDSKYEYVIQLPVVGRMKDSVDITLEDKNLIIKVKATLPTEEKIETIHTGLALRGYERIFTLTEDMEVLNAKVDNGLLEIVLCNKSKENSILNIPIT